MKTKRLSGGRLSALAVAGSLALAGCDDAAGPDDVISAGRAGEIAAFLADVETLAGVSAMLGEETRARSFSRTVPCPAGGSVTVSGSGESTRDPDTRVVSHQWTTTQAHESCAFTRERGEEQLTAVIHGSVTTSGSASYQLPEERGGERVILTYASSRVGSTTTTVGDRSRVCEVDVTETYDPATGTFTITGMVCGHEVNRTRGQGQRQRG